MARCDSSGLPGLSRRQLLAGCVSGAVAAPRVGRTQAAGRDARALDLAAGMHLVLTGSGAALPVPERGNAGAYRCPDGADRVDPGERARDAAPQCRRAAAPRARRAVNRVKQGALDTRALQG